MSAPGDQDVPDDDEAQGVAPNIKEVSGGQHGQTYMGGQYITTQINKTFNPVGASGKPQKPGVFQVPCLISIYESCPISIPSRIFKGSLHSDVTGDRDAAVKITAAERRNYREAKIHFSVPHHKNIVERIATDTFNFRGQSSIFIAMERCDCNLYDFVKSEERDEVAFDSDKYTRINYQILEGLDCLHSHNVVHGDLKPSNVLLILNGNVVKLSDFGLSRAITEGHDSTQITSPQGGSSGWLAPEILEGTTQISKSSDIFPCGLVFHFTWSHGKHAYGDNPVSRNHYIMVGENRDLSRMLINFMDEATTLLEKMFQRNPVNRPATREILQSPIFRRFGRQANRVDDAQVAEVFDQVLRLVSNQGEVVNLSQDPVVITGQIPTAVQAYLERNDLQIVRKSSGRQISRVGPTSARSSVAAHPTPRHSQHTLSQQQPPTRQDRNSAYHSSTIEQSRRAVTSSASQRVATPTGPQISPGTTRSSSVTEPKSTSGPSLSLPQPPHHSPVPASSIEIQPQKAASSNASASPRNPPDTSLLHRDCDLILVSTITQDQQYLPELTSKIFGTASYNGKREFMQCDRKPDPKMIQDRLSNMAVCAEGITMVIVAWSNATIPLAKALEENNLRSFLQNKRNLKQQNILEQRIQNIRRNLAVFTFGPCEDISQSSAKIAVNIGLRRDKNNETGKLQVDTLWNGKVVKKIRFQQTTNHVYYDVDEFIKNSEVMEFIKRTLHHGL